MSHHSKMGRELMHESDTVIREDEDSLVGRATTENGAKISRDMEGSLYQRAADNSSDTSSEASFNYNTVSKDIWEEGQRYQSTMYASMMAAQNDFLTSSHGMQAAAAAASYYRWLPGINSMSFPAFFYPPEFLGYNQQFMWRNKATKLATGETENHLHSHKHTSESDETSGETKEEESKCEKEQSVIKTKDIINDIDEGLVLEENECEMSDTGRVPRNKQGTTVNSEYQQTSQVATVSVIQENNFSKHSAAVALQNGVDKEASKRGRASTRHIAKTEQYWDRRKKNNMSAKKSRDARRQREMMTNQRSAMLEAENLRLRAELAAVREENERLRKLYKSTKNV